MLGNVPLATTPLGGKSAVKKYLLTPSGLINVLSFGTDTLSQIHNLTISNLTDIPLLATDTLSQTHNLTSNNLSDALTISSDFLSVVYSFVINNLNSPMNVSLVDVVSGIVLYALGLTSSLQSNNATLSQIHSLQINDEYTAVICSLPQITLNYNLTITNVLEKVQESLSSLIQDYHLIGNGLSLQEIFGNSGLKVNYVFVNNNLNIPSATTSGSVSQEIILRILSILSQTKEDSNTISQHIVFHSNGVQLVALIPTAKIAEWKKLVKNGMWNKLNKNNQNWSKEA